LRDELPEHLLGFRGQPEWLDMSDYLVHFTDTETKFRSILTSGHLRPGGPFGWGRRQPNIRAEQSSACLSEVPFGRHGRLIDRHGDFGIGFHREFIKAQGGARVWYLDDGSAPSRALFVRVGEVIRAGNWTDELWNLTPFIDRVMPGKYEWDWEREWRVPGGFYFTLDDVAFVITPEGVEEHPGLSAPMLYPGEGAIWVPSVPDALGKEVERMIGVFLEDFENPLNSLPVEGGEYVWIVESWETEDAVEWCFDNLEPSVFSTLCDHLNDISPQWVRVADWDSFYE
jgi:hypothetical protein